MQNLDPSDPADVGGYPLLARLGAGGMGRVYLSRTRSGRPLALKMIHTYLVDEPGFEKRFAREIANSDRVRSPWNVTVVDFSRAGQRPQWLATEYVPAPSLSEWLAARGPLPPEELLSLAAELCGALQAVHQVDMTHRDIKPGNILLARDRPRLIDFGIARAANDSRHTHTGGLIGSPGYLAPEQVTNNAAASTPSDVFSLSAVLVCAATGQGPFSRPGEDASAAVLVYRIVHEEPYLDAVPEPLRSVLRPCLAKKPEQRPTVGQWKEQLERLGARTGRWSTALGPALLADLDAREQASSHWLRAGDQPRPASPPAPSPTVVQDQPPTRSAPQSPFGAPPPNGFPPSPSTPELPAAARPTRRRALLGLSALATVAAGGAGTWLVLRETSPPADQEDPKPKPKAQTRWRYSVPGFGAALSPVAAMSMDGAELYVGTGKGLHALGLDGTPRWQFPTNGPVSTPAVNRNGIYFCNFANDRLHALDAAGTKRWSTEPAWSFRTRPTVARDTVWAGTEAADSGRLQSWSAKNEYGLVVNLGKVFLGAELVAAGQATYAAEGNELCARDIETDAELWRLDLGGTVGQPAVSDGTIFVSTDNAQRELHGVDLAGNVTFSRPGRGGAFPSIPVATKATCFTLEDGALLATDSQGKPLWNYQPEGVRLLANTATVAESTVYVHGGDSLYAVDLEGRPRWRVRTGTLSADLGLRPLVNGRWIYVASDSGIVAVEVAAGA